MDKLLELAIEASRSAQTTIMSFYNAVLSVHLKQDSSPLTLADRAAHDMIVSCLAKSGLPIVSEEGDDLYMNANEYWLVDPLDGTKDFLSGSDEFTINIALIKARYPVLGVVLAPALDDLYWGSVDMGAGRILKGCTTALLPHEQTASCRMAVSRFHNHPDVDIFAAENRIDKLISVGSALKYGLLATAEIDVFPRLTGSSEWDTAAGQALLEAVGGSVLDWSTGKSLSYGKPKRRNPRLLAIRAPYRYEEFRLKKYEAELL